MAIHRYLIASGPSQLSKLVAWGLIVGIGDFIGVPQLAWVVLAVCLTTLRRPEGYRYVLMALIVATDIFSLQYTDLFRQTLYTSRLPGLPSPALIAIVALGASSAVSLRGRRKLGIVGSAHTTTFVPVLGGIILLGTVNGLANGSAVQAVLLGTTPWVWLATGWVIVLRYGRGAFWAILLALSVKAFLQTAFWIADGIDMGPVLRTSFDSSWLAMPMVVGASLYFGRRVPMWLHLGAIMALGAVASSYTRQAWLALIASIVGALAGRYRERRLRAALLIVLIVLAAGISLFAQRPDAHVYASRFFSIKQVILGREASMDLRWHEAQDIYSTVGGSFLFGRGFGSSFDLATAGDLELTEAAYRREEIVTRTFTRAHVPMLTLYLHAGLVGLAGWMWLTGGGFIAAYRRRDPLWGPLRAILFAAAFLLAGAWTPKLLVLSGVVAGLPDAGEAPHGKE